MESSADPRGSREVEKAPIIRELAAWRQTIDHLQNITVKDRERTFDHP